MNNFLIIWFYRVFVALVLGIGVAVSFWLEWKYERQVAVTGCTVRVSTKRNTVIFVIPWALPIMMAIYWLIYAPFFGPALATDSLVEFSLQLLVVLSLYFALLLLLLPLLRRTISARACATLWLLPVFLYYDILLWQLSFVPPLVVLSIPNGLGPVLLGIWLAGAGAVVLWYLVSHLRFRRRLLKDARPVEDVDVINLWWDEHRLALVKQRIRLVTSPAVSSPLTIGLFNRTMCTVLPERNYTLDQYQLIFRHELRHVQRWDISTKCFYLFCKALCWFNPLMWAAIRKASADLELSCDEMVVYDAEDDTRREYAALLLETAGDDRGFTTCLSASASSLRRRLRRVVAPGKRTSGAVLLGLTMALLILCYGVVTVGIEGSGRDLVLTPYGAEQAVAAALVEDEQDLRQESLDGDRAQALEAYLSQLPLTRLSAAPTYYPRVDDSERRFYLTLRCSNGSQLEVRWDDQFCVVRRENRDLALFRMDGPVNWDDLRTLAA